jgi:hypothetical protein
MVAVMQHVAEWLHKLGLDQYTHYRAMLAGDAAVLEELCSDDLIYTHKRSYLHKVGTRYFTYLEITHPADRILVVDGAALVSGRMTAKVSVTGEIRRLPADADHEDMR